jgi:hypothetical protein
VRFALAVLMLLLPRPAAAEERRWYGAPALVSDFAAVSVAFATGFRPPVVFVCAAAYSLVPPVVHLGRERVGMAGVSLAMRGASIAAVISGASRIGSAKCDGECSHNESASYWLVGGLFAMVVASGIDIAVLSSESVPPRVTVAPAIDRTSAGVTFSLML